MIMNNADNNMKNTNGSYLVAINTDNTNYTKKVYCSASYLAVPRLHGREVLGEAGQLLGQVLQFTEVVFVLLTF